LFYEPVTSLPRRNIRTTKQKNFYKPFKFLHAMNALKNKVQLIGRVGKDPEIKTLTNGKKVATLSLATNDVYVNKQGDRMEQTQWHTVEAWGRTVDIIERYVSKGKEIGLTGKLTTRSYDDKEGNKRYVTKVMINELLLM
jgi:single-strand DNA-binding protein